jgi:hypothetical protein
MPGVPVGLNRVKSAAELTQAAKNSGLTHVTLPSLDYLWIFGLGWNTQYSQFPTVVSMGPKIKMFACSEVPQQCAPFRIWSAGAERFVAAINMMPINISVHSDKPLSSVSLYNGRSLYRRFAPSKAQPNVFAQTLLLDGEVDKNLVLIAEDVDGGKAVSFAHRNWKDGQRAPMFCADHENDCKSGGMLLSHGPGPLLNSWVNPIPPDLAGSTWDGGPKAQGWLLRFAETSPNVYYNSSASGVGNEETGSRFSVIPKLEFADEGALAVSQYQVCSPLPHASSLATV